jgi:hypothetical protein
MGVRTWIEGWPVYRQLADGDPLGRGAAAKSPASGRRKDGPEIESGELRTADIGTEVFFMPAAAHTEKAGSLSCHPLGHVPCRAGVRQRSEIHGDPAAAARDGIQATVPGTASRRG